jgi:hypothetical protein
VTERRERERGEEIYKEEERILRIVQVVKLVSWKIIERLDLEG